MADPAKGLIKYTSEEFCANWLASDKNGSKEGIALFLNPTEQFYSTNHNPINYTKSHFKSIFKYILPYKRSIIKVFICLAFATALQLVLPFLTRTIIDKGISTKDLHFVTLILIAQLALFTGHFVVDVVRNWILTHVSLHINISILSDFMGKLVKLPVAFFDSKRTGDILQRMNDHSRIESFLTGSSLNTLFSLINLFIFSIVLIFFNLKIFWIFLIASFVYSLWGAFFLKKRKELDYKRFAIASQEQSMSIQLVQGMQEIKLHGIEKSMKDAWQKLQHGLYKIGIKGLRLNQIQQGGSFFINEGKNLIITFFSAKAVIEGQMTLGSMMAIQFIVGQLNSPIEQMIGFLQSWQNAKISMDRLNEIHKLDDEEPENKEIQYHFPPAFAAKIVGGMNNIENASEPVTSNPRLNEPDETKPRSLFDPASLTEASIYFKNVSFTYIGAGNETVLRDINLSIPKGKTTAIVGVSGSGKTTLLKLLLKFYEPQKGSIKLDSVPFSSMSHKLWRSHCGVVMQESFLFSDTIARNIAVGTDKVDKKKFYKAVEVANVREFVERLPVGFNTKIGAEGTAISMGQKQRILIARAVYKNPEFIFFDEATNSLDANNESIIIHNLQSFLKGKTVVIVAHRLSTVKNADQIVVLNQGMITERGTHQELVNARGEYYTLVKNQLELGV